MVTSVVSNLSHSDYLNIPITVDNKLLATKKKGQSYYCIEMFQVSRDKLLAPARNIPGVQVRDGSLHCCRL